MNLRRISSFFLLTFSFLLLHPQKGSYADELRVPIQKSNGPRGDLDGWNIREWKGKAEFAIVDTEIGKALHLKSHATSSALYRSMTFNIKDYPVLRWKWKVTEIPKGADVRKKDKDDQAAQVYVVFPRFPAAINSRIIGYIWDSTVPKGLSLTSTKTSNTRYIILRSGSDDLGRWVQEKRNVYEDYKRLFREEPPQVGSISVMIDSDDTQSSAESFVGDIYFSRE